MATGTGLPIPKGQPVLTQAPTVIDGDKFSSAAAWGRIASAGASIADTGTDLLRKEMRQQQMKQLADSEVTWTRDYLDMRDKFANNPRGFEEAAQAYNEGALARAPTWMAPHAQKFLGGKLNGSLQSVLTETRSRDERLERDSTEARRALAGNEIIAMAEAGNVTGGAWLAANATHDAVLTAQVNAGFISQERADLQREELMGKAYSAVAARHGVEIYKDKTLNEDGGARGGYAKAVEYLQKEILENDRLNVKPASRHAAFTAGIKAINVQRRLETEDRQTFIREAEDTIQQLKANVPVDAGVIEDQLSALKQSGAAGMYRRLYVEAKTKEFGFGAAVKPSEQMALLAGMRADVIQNQAARYFIGKGYNPMQAAGIVANLAAEGGARLNANAVNRGDGRDGSDSIGIGQWNGPRAQALKSFAAAQGKPWNDLQVQLDFVDHELRGSESAAGAMLQAARTPEEAARAILHYERPKDYETGHGYRLANARNLFDRQSRGELDPAFGGAVLNNLQKQFSAQMKKDWPEYKKNITDGKPIDDNDFGAIYDAAKISGDAHWIKEVEDLGIAQNLISAARQMDMASRQSLVDEARGRFTDLVVRTLEAGVKRQNELVANNPVQFHVENGGAAPTPLNTADSATFRAGLQQRASIAAAVAADQRAPLAAALREPEVQSVRAALDAADLPGKARIYGDIATLPEDQRALVLGKLGSAGKGAMVEAFAGAMYGTDPKIAESIMRGQKAIAADTRFNPTKGGNATTFNDIMDKAMPGTAFTLASRTSETGSWSTFRSAVIARYADLSAQSGDSAGTLSEERLKRAVDDVTGGVLTHNGGKFIAPQRGMSQAHFDGIMRGLSDSDLPGMTTLSGETITADYLRRSARLESIGDGRYLVQLGTDPLKPIYAFIGVDVPFARPQPFILDLRGRVSAPLAASGYLPPADGGVDFR